VCTQLPVEWVTDSPSPRLKRPVNEAADSPPSNAKSNNAGSYISTLLSLDGTHRDNLAFYQKISFLSVSCHYFRHYRDDIYTHQQVVLDLLRDFTKSEVCTDGSLPSSEWQSLNLRTANSGLIGLTYFSELSHLYDTFVSFVRDANKDNPNICFAHYQFI
jgi:hypothetical protein